MSVAKDLERQSVKDKRSRHNKAPLGLEDSGGKGIIPRGEIGGEPLLSQEGGGSGLAITDCREGDALWVWPVGNTRHNISRSPTRPGKPADERGFLCL